MEMVTVSMNSLPTHATVPQASLAETVRLTSMSVWVRNAVEMVNALILWACFNALVNQDLQELFVRLMSMNARTKPAVEMVSVWMERTTLLVSVSLGSQETCAVKVHNVLLSAECIK